MKLEPWRCAVVALVTILAGLAMAAWAGHGKFGIPDGTGTSAIAGVEFVILLSLLVPPPSLKRVALSAVIALVLAALTPGGVWICRLVWTRFAGGM